MTTPPPPYQPGGFQPGPYPPNPHRMGGQPQAKKSNGVGLVALILGVVVILLAVVSIAPLLTVIVAGVAIIVGIVAVALRNRTKGTAIAGLICAGIGLVLMPILHPHLFSGLFGGTQQPQSYEIVYKVYSEKTGQVYYLQDREPKEERFKGHWEKTIVATRLPYLNIQVQGDIYNYSDTAVSCEIIVNGETVMQRIGKGGAACSYYKGK